MMTIGNACTPPCGAARPLLLVITYPEAHAFVPLWQRRAARASTTRLLASPPPGPKDRWLSDTVWQDKFSVQWDRVSTRYRQCLQLRPSERDLSRLECRTRTTPRSSGFAITVGRCERGSSSVRHRFLALRRAWTLRGMEALFDMLEPRLRRRAAGRHLRLQRGPRPRAVT